MYGNYENIELQKFDRNVKLLLNKMLKKVEIYNLQNLMHFFNLSNYNTNIINQIMVLNHFGWLYKLTLVFINKLIHLEFILFDNQQVSSSRNLFMKVMITRFIFLSPFI